MEIRFSKQVDFLEETLIRVVATVPAMVSNLSGISPVQNSVRFTLRELTLPRNRPASVAQHDQVIRALLTFDPDATIRTARAVYEGLADFEAQLKARETVTS